MLFRDRIANLCHKNQVTDAGKTMFPIKTLRHLRSAASEVSVMEEKMYGVVLWTDAADKKAVIWCEDHGNLAYYCEAEPTVHTGAGLGAGDLIAFDMTEECDVRTAQNLRRVNASYAPTLARKLNAVQPKQELGDNVIPFGRRRHQ
ncbi:MAG: hypothetical protein JXQ89_21110 [Pelagimonas sp.]